MAKDQADEFLIVETANTLAERVISFRDELNRLRKIAERLMARQADIDEELTQLEKAISLASVRGAAYDGLKRVRDSLRKEHNMLSSYLDTKLQYDTKS